MLFNEILVERMNREGFPDNTGSVIVPVVPELDAIDVYVRTFRKRYPEEEIVVAKSQGSVYTSTGILSKSKGTVKAYKPEDYIIDKPSMTLEASGEPVAETTILSDGTFQIDLPVGEYTVEIHKQGYLRVIIQNVKVGEEGKGVYLGEYLIYAGDIVNTRGDSWGFIDLSDLVEIVQMKSSDPHNIIADFDSDGVITDDDVNMTIINRDLLERVENWEDTGKRYSTTIKTKKDISKAYLIENSTYYYDSKDIAKRINNCIKDAWKTYNTYGNNMFTMSQRWNKDTEIAILEYAYSYIVGEYDRITESDYSGKWIIDEVTPSSLYLYYKPSTNKTFGTISFTYKDSIYSLDVEIDGFVYMSSAYMKELLTEYFKKWCTAYNIIPTYWTPIVYV